MATLTRRRQIVNPAFQKALKIYRRAYRGYRSDSKIVARPIFMRGRGCQFNGCKQKLYRYSSYSYLAVHLRTHHPGAIPGTQPKLDRSMPYYIDAPPPKEWWEECLTVYED